MLLMFVYLIHIEFVQQRFSFKILLHLLIFPHKDTVFLDIPNDLLVALPPVLSDSKNT